MKKILLTSLLSFAFLINANAQQWIEKTSCNKDASKIVNEAITSLSNLEHLMAIGMAKAALVVDENCECAKLVIAAAASNNSDWGSRSEKLQNINVKSLTEIERTWHILLSTSNDNYNKAVEKAISMHPNSPLINWFGTSVGNWESFREFSKKFPRNSSAAYNMMAYAYARGDYGEEPDFDSAYQSIAKSLILHKGPNALDSEAEIAAMQGDYEKAVNSQLKAFDYAPFASPYLPKLRTYSRNLNKENVVKNLKQAQIDVQEAIENQNIEVWKNYTMDDMKLMTGDSSLTKFYEQTDELFLEKRNFSWDSFDLRDIDVNFSPDMNMAILTFYASGAYTLNESNEKVDYSTRASAVWIATDSGWKMVHANWAPFGGAGIPQ